MRESLSHAAVCFARDSVLNRNPFDYVSSDSSLATVVEAGGSWVGMASKVLDVFQWDSLGKQVGDRGHSEGMGRQAGR